MLLWRVEYRGKVLSTLGTVSSMDEKSAVDKAAEIFKIPFADRNRLFVTEIKIHESLETKTPTTSAAGAEVPRVVEGHTVAREPVQFAICPQMQSPPTRAGNPCQRHPPHHLRAPSPRTACVSNIEQLLQVCSAICAASRIKRTPFHASRVLWLPYCGSEHADTDRGWCLRRR